MVDETKESENTELVKPQDEAPTTNEAEPSILERATKIRDDTLAAEKRIDDKIQRFEKRVAEGLLSGRAEMVPIKTDEEKIKETAAAAVNRFFD